MAIDPQTYKGYVEDSITIHNEKIERKDNL